MNEGNVHEDSWISVRGNFIANTEFDKWHLIESKLNYGIWDDPPCDECFGKGADWKNNSNGFMTGVEGYVVYANEGNTLVVQMYWMNPFIGSTAYSCYVVTQPEGESYEISYYETYNAGGQADVNFTLTKK